MLNQERHKSIDASLRPRRIQRQTNIKEREMGGGGGGGGRSLTNRPKIIFILTLGFEEKCTVSHHNCNQQLKCYAT